MAFRSNSGLLDGARRAIACALVIVAAMVFATAAVRAEERIISYASEVWIDPDASVLVRETIEVEAEGIDIRRGIYRDFPTTYQSRHGTRIRVGFDVEKVTRNGAAEPYFTDDRANGIRLYIGSSDVYLSPGRYTYEITYRTDRQLGFFENFDEFYWNVTGNGWSFTIEKATARVHLPEGAEVTDVDAWTGEAGAKGTDFNTGLYADDDVWFETTRPLSPGEGFTIAVAWPKGFVTAPSTLDELRWFVRDNLVTAAAIAGVVGLLLYYLLVWSKAGRDPKGGTIIPRYYPPEGVSPAAARFVEQMGFDNKAFTAAVVSMAVKGYLTIKQSKSDKYTLIKEKDTTTGLSSGERAVASKLFTRSRTEIEMKQKNHKAIGGARTALKSALSAEFDKTHFVHNWGYFAVGVLLSIGALVIMAFGAAEAAGATFITVWLSVWTLGCAALLARTFSVWSSVISGREWSNIAVAIPTTLFTIPFLVGWGFGAWLFTETASILNAIMIAVLIGMNVLFFYLLKAPTLLGREVLDEIEGFKMFLSVTEKDRMNLLNPPDRTPELFEAYLPYALAMGVEQQWSEQFADVLATIGPERDGHRTGYRPGWYTGRGFDGNFTSMSSGLSSGLSSAIASSSTAPGSSSGSGGGFSGGGGSSGGGGGGGGGGGW